jgi:cell division septation protein DedD
VTTQALPPEPAKPVTRPAPTETKPVAAETKPATPVTRPAAPAPKPAAPSTPAASGVGYAVQLGAFSNAGDANALRDRVRAAGFSAFVEQVRTDKGTLSRVRVGPVADRAEADRLKTQVAAKVGIDGMVRPHP